MRWIAAALGLLTAGCYGYPRRGKRAHHAQIDVAMGGGARRTTGVRDDAQLSRVASSSALTGGLSARLFAASGHGRGMRLEAAQGGGEGPTLGLTAIDAVYAYERNAGDGALSLVGLAGPSRTRSHVTRYCDSSPASGVELAWRATRPVEDSPAGWNHIVMAHARVGLDIARATEGAR